MGRLETERGMRSQHKVLRTLVPFNIVYPHPIFTSRGSRKNERISYKDALSAAILYYSNESGCSWQIFEYWTTTPGLNVQGSRFQGPK